MLDTELITYLAKLSKLAINEADKERLVTEMSAIVDLMDTMNEINLDPAVNLNGEGRGLGALRKDEAIPSFDREVLLSNAAHKKDGFFVVPKIMD